MDTVKRLALRLKIHRVSGTVVHHAAFLKKVLDRKGIRSELVKGFCVVTETNEACAHYWVRTLDECLDLDIGFEVAKLKTPELQALTPILLESIPLGVTRSDETEHMIRAENERLYELYQRDSIAFWRDSPKDLRALRLD